MKNDFEKRWEEEEFTQLVGALSSYVHPGEFYFEINHGRKLDQKYTQFFLMCFCICLRVYVPFTK